jgi:hypothetical protein
MNMKTINLSVLVVAGLVLGNMPARLEAMEAPQAPQAQPAPQHEKNTYKPTKTVIALFLTLAAINYILDCKESVENPENDAKWSDLWALDLNKITHALNQKVLGQKGKDTAIKIAANGKGEYTMKGTKKCPATGICGNGYAVLTGVAKSTGDAVKVLAVPAIVLAIWAKGLKFTDKDGTLAIGVDFSKLADFKILKAAPAA